jgi:hypothetical protein
MPHKATLVARATPIARKKFPNATASQLAGIIDATVSAPWCSTFVAEGWSTPTDDELDWHLGHFAGKNPDLSRAVPTPEQYVATKVAEYKAKDISVSASDRIGWLREAQEMGPDALLAAVPHDAPALKVPVTVKAVEPARASPRTMDDATLDIYLAERAGFANVHQWHHATLPSAIRQAREVARVMDRKTVPAQSSDMAQHIQKTAKPFDASDPAFAALSPAERLNLYREHRARADCRPVL